jgi:predicted PurR-regulated permease PerM
MGGSFPIQEQSMNGDPPPASRRPVSLLTGGAIVAALYFGRDFFLPLVLAILISFLLAPLVRRLEGWRLGRIGSVIITATLSFSVIAAVGYVATGQLIDLANQLPKYKDNMRAKVAALRSQKETALNKATKALKEITEEVTEETPAEGPPAPGTGRPPTGAAMNETGKRVAPPPPVPVQVVNGADNAVDLLKGFVAPLLGPLGDAAVVSVLVIFMLLGREDFRDRIIHLVGRGRLHVTTQALDDAGRRVSRYLLAQLVVNTCYGIPIGVGLYFLGIPNAVLWGFLATMLRFVPYVGPWLAAAIPLLLALAVSTTWEVPLATIGLFIAAELISNNILEPWLYAASTGLSPLAVITSAVFWTWLWGSIGLILATPLTVCLAVLGKHLPSFAWLDVLLADSPPIAASDRLYQRLLASDEEEALNIVEEYVEQHSLAAAYDHVVLPAIRQAEADCRTEIVNDARRREIYGMVRRLLAELDDAPARPAGDAVTVLCLPASSEADELVAVMLAHLLEQRAIHTHVLSSKSLSSEIVEQVAESGARICCISALPPASVMPATYLARRIRARLPEARVLIGLWHDAETDSERRLKRFKRAQADDVFTTLERTATEVALLAGLKQEPTTAPAKAA